MQTMNELLTGFFKRKTVVLKGVLGLPMKTNFFSENVCSKLLYVCLFLKHFLI